MHFSGRMCVFRSCSLRLCPWIENLPSLQFSHRCESSTDLCLPRRHVFHSSTSPAASSPSRSTTHYILPSPPFYQRKQNTQTYLLHQPLDLDPKRVLSAAAALARRRGRRTRRQVQVQLLLRRARDVGAQISQVRGRLQVDLAVVRVVHWRAGWKGRVGDRVLMAICVGSVGIEDEVVEGFWIGGRISVWDWYSWFCCGLVDGKWSEADLGRPCLLWRRDGGWVR